MTYRRLLFSQRGAAIPKALKVVIVVVLVIGALIWAGRWNQASDEKAAARELAWSQLHYGQGRYEAAQDLVGKAKSAIKREKLYAFSFDSSLERTRRNAAMETWREVIKVAEDEMGQYYHFSQDYQDQMSWEYEKQMNAQDYAP